MTLPRVLTFNFHEPYLCLMARTGLPLTVGLYEKPPFARPWQHRFRSLPANITLAPESQWRGDLEAGRFDVVVAQNEMNAADVFSTRTPGLLVCHNRKSFLRTTVSGPNGRDVEGYERLLERLRDRFRFVFISESKRADYGIDGPVIPPGIDVEEYGGYTGRVREVLRVGNSMRARNLMFDVDLQERVCAGLPHRIVGEDPDIPAAKPSTSFEDLLNQYRSLRCLLHVTREEWEDGYNLSLLEALACGMPVVSLANRTSPLTDGVDGYVSDDPEVLRARLEELLNDPERAETLGARGRETVAKKFPLDPFVERWREVIEEAAASGPRRRAPRRPAVDRRNIILEYVASPITTARYLEAALRREHNVVAAGLRCPEAVLKTWGFSEPIPDYPPHAIDLPLRARASEIVRRAGEGFEPDLYLWVDSGAKELPDGFDELSLVKACYLIDTHVDPATRLEIARHFDYVFLAQKAQVPQFRDAGLRHVEWLPLACAPELHDRPPAERIYDVAYVGSLSDASPRRRELLESVRRRFPNNRIGRAWPHEMAQIYGQARIVVNACVNRDLNMRVFEALASGALLITDEADGLEDLFEDGRHLVIYRNDDELFDKIERYLADKAARERIAAAGREEVLARHTYDHRMRTLVDAVRRPAGPRRPVHGGAPDARFEEGGYYRSTRPELVPFIPADARRVLDIGCGAGEFGRVLKSRGAEEVVGIEVVERAWDLARRALDQAFLGNIEEMELPFDDGYFDCICCADVLEHLVNPTEVLRKLSRVLSPRGCIVMSIPNVRFCQVVQMLAHGRWKYEDAGILDRTHLRFFTATDMVEMVREAGLEAVRLQPLSMLDAAHLPRNADGSVTLGRMTLQGVDDVEYRDLLTYQYLLVAGKPGLHRLELAQKSLDEGRNEEAYGLAQTALAGDAFTRKRIMAKALARLGKLDSAAALYREALALEPDHGAAACELGLVLLGMNRPGDARPLLERALAGDPHDDKALAGLGLVALADGREDEAFDRFRASLDAEFDNGPVLGHLLAVAERLNRLEEVEPYLRRFVDFYPGNADMACRHVKLLRDLGRREEARDRLETLLLVAPDNAEARALREAGWD